MLVALELLDQGDQVSPLAELWDLGTCRTRTNLSTELESAHQNKLVTATFTRVAEKEYICCVL